MVRIFLLGFLLAAAGPLYAAPADVFPDLGIKDPACNLNLQGPAPEPDPPLFGAEGGRLSSVDDFYAPAPDQMDELLSQGFFSPKEVDSREDQPTRYVWHFTDGTAFCHYYDMEGNHWYGWDREGKFSWARFQAGHFGWQDPVTNRWLVYAQGNWWWQDPQNSAHLQAYQGGRYYAYDSRQGALLPTALDPGGIASAPGRYRGDFRHGGGHGWGRGGRVAAKSGGGS